MSVASTSPKRIPFSKLPSSLSRNKLLNINIISPKVLIIQNDLLCNACTAIASLIDHDITYHVIYAFHDNAFKLLHPFMYDAIIILGGRNGVYEDEKWIKTEMNFITNALILKIPIFGICLGSQLLAKCIGGTVYVGANGVEIGYKKWIFIDQQQYEDQDDTKNEKTEHNESKTDLKLKNIGVSKSNPYLDNDLIKGFKTFSLIQNKSFIDTFNHKEKYNKQCIDNDNDDDDDIKTHRNDNNNDDDDDADFNEDEFDENESVKSDKIEYIENVMNDTLDPFVDAICCQDMDKYILLFHGDTFNLPKRCIVSGQKVYLLATTNQYNTLFRVGKYSYGFQGHPELNVDMLRVWCKCWGDSFLNRWNGDLEKDVIEYAQKYENKIKSVGRAIFDIWCKEIVLKTTNKNKLLQTRSVGFILQEIDEGTDSPEF